MLHQAVIREDHTISQLRIVYGASYKLKGPSLNDCLEAGESKYTDLFGNLIRFKLHNIAVVADIEKTFLNNGIQEDVRDALRFLWKEDPDPFDIKLQPCSIKRGAHVRNFIKKEELSPFCRSGESFNIFSGKPPWWSPFLLKFQIESLPLQFH